MKDSERELVLGAIKATFVYKLFLRADAKDDGGAASAVRTALELCSFDEKRETNRHLLPADYVERARLAKEWRRAGSAGLSWWWSNADETEAVLCGAMAMGLAHADDAEDAKNFASELANCTRSRDANASPALERELKAPFDYMFRHRPERLRMIFEAATYQTRLTCRYPVYDMAAHYFVKTDLFFELFRPAA